MKKLILLAALLSGCTMTDKERLEWSAALMSVGNTLDRLDQRMIEIYPPPQTQHIYIHDDSVWTGTHQGPR
jgi:hypothetical protein